MHARIPALEAAWPGIASALPLFFAGDNVRLQTVCAALSDFLEFQGRWDEKLALCEKAEARAAAAADHEKAGWRAYHAGMIHYQRRQADAVLASAERADAHWARAKAGARERAIAISLRGTGHYLKKDYSAAIVAYSEVLKLDRSLAAESEDVAGDLNDLATAECEFGDLAGAEGHYREALRVARAVRDAEGVAIYTGNLAWLALAREDWPDAATLAREALPLSEAVHRQELIASNNYLTNVSAWLGQQAPADPQKVTPAALATLLGKPGVALALAQRQFIAKVEPGKLGAFAKADATHKPFLTWLLKNPDALQLYLLGATPLSLAAREDNSYGLATGALDNWAKIFTADPASRDGIYLRLAIATALRPPGTGSPGSGQQKTPSTPLVRYTYFKTAHAKKELFPSFDNLTVWEMQFVVCSGASETDLSWGREMVNTYRPDLLAGEKVVDTTSLVWRRNSPISHVDYKTVLDGGGKCGPRSSWSVFI